MLNGLKPYNYLTYVMEQMKDLSPFLQMSSTFLLC